MVTIEISLRVMKEHLQMSYRVNLAIILQALSGDNLEVRKWVD